MIKVKIFSDGAARGNPGKAGWGAVLLLEKKEIEIGGAFSHATNNQMELTAVIEALKFLQKKKIKYPVEIYTDSKYVLLGITEWILNWQKNNWRTANKKPVLNKELWQDLVKLSKDFKITWHYVPGHQGHLYNERADQIATSLADGLAIDLKK